ncbi:MAG: CPBP family intramembrane metalloprotease [Chlorobium sp.]|nr:CPBP family intramembrane metalloprotease [Chlorobium sp.]
MTEGRNSNRPSAVMDYIACMMEQDEMTVNTKTQYPEKHHSRTHFLMVLALLYWLPVATILTGMVPFSLRSLLLLLMFVFTAIYAIMQGHSAAELGLENFNLRTSLAVNLPAGITAAGVVFLLPIAGVHDRLLPPPEATFIFFYVLISSPVQEFLFRSFLFSEMRRSNIHSPIWQVVISAMSFAFLHAVYLDPLTGLLSFAAGIMWSIIYQRIPNLAEVSLSHAIIGIMAIMSGVARKI